MGEKTADKSRLIPRPLRARLDLTYRCNLECKHCYLRKKANISQELSTSEIKKLIDELKYLGTMIITISGGEVFLREDVFDVFNYISQSGMVINIYSNLNTLSKEIIRELNKYSIGEIETSIYGVRPFSHDSITGKKGSFEKTVKNIKMLKNNGFKVKVKSTILEKNRKEYAGIVGMAEKLGVKFGCGDYILRQKKNKNSGNIDYYRVSSNCLREIYSLPYIQNKILNVEKIRERHFNFSSPNLNKPVCGVAYYIIYIDAYGEVYPCRLWFKSLGNIRSTAISDIWLDSFNIRKIRELKMEDLTVCLKCKYIDYCDICPAIIYDLDSGKAKCNYHFCKKARVLHDLINKKRGG